MQLRRPHRGGEPALEVGAPRPALDGRVDGDDRVQVFPRERAHGIQRFIDHRTPPNSAPARPLEGR